MKETYPARKYRKRTLKELNTYDRASIVHDNLVDLRSQEDVARQHRVSKTLVSRLAKTLRKNHNALKELQAKEDKE